MEQPSLSLWAWWGPSQNSQQAACPWGTSLPASKSPLFGPRGTPTSQPLPLHLAGVSCPESVFGRGLRGEALVRHCYAASLVVWGQDSLSSHFFSSQLT